MAVSLAGCQGHKETIGTIGGAALGALAGSEVGKGRGQLVAVAGGTLLGAFIGSRIGRALDERDVLLAEQAKNRALERNPTGQTSSWNNPDSGNHGTVTPIRTGKADTGEPCREYKTTVTVGGDEVEAYGTACRNPDGTWRIVN